MTNYATKLSKAFEEAVIRSWFRKDYECYKCHGLFDRWHFNGMVGMCDECVERLWGKK